MKLKKLLEDINVKKIIGSKALDISNLACKDSEVEKNGMFFCLAGSQNDGHAFADDAVHKGAICLVTERQVQIDGNVTQIIVENSRAAMSQIAKNFFGKTCDKLKIVTIVGTNGKTTTSYILNQILNRQGIKSALIGTNGTIVSDSIKIESKLTTPDPIELHYLFKQLHALKVEVVILEASAHAIYLNKLAGVTSEVAIFTNLSNEHLDFFKTMEEYERVKMSHFNADNVKNAVINVDDNTGLKILNSGEVEVLSYGLANPASTFAIDIAISIKGTTFVVNALDNILEIKTKLVGLHNVYNTLASINAALLLGCSPETIIDSLKDMPAVPGRFNVYSLDCNNKVIIDYAHTPDGFEKVLSLIKSLRHGKIITIFGCVGYSDSVKRSEMGKIAARYSDHIILTTDNPNFVDFATINADIKAGFENFNNYCEIFDRQTAICDGVCKLTKNDTLVILGKGVEVTNKINGLDVECNDLKSLNDAIEKVYNFKKVENKLIV